MKEKDITSTKLANYFLVQLLSVVLFVSAVQASDVTFTWTGNTPPDDGYFIYYKTGTTGGGPYNGTGISEGPSPVATGNVTRFTLHGLSDTETYFFVLTATANGQESDYSAELVWRAPSKSKDETPGIHTDFFGDTPDSSHPGTLADTFIKANDNRYSTENHLNTWSWSSSAPYQPANTIIIKADLSALAQNIQVSEAKLYLYQTNTSGNAAYSNSIHKITGKNPVINQVTGNNASNNNPWTPVTEGTTSNNVPLGLGDIAAAEDTITLGNQNGYQIWTVTEMVQEWISNPATNFGLLISGVTTTTETGRVFASSENDNASIRPKLVVSYLTKPPKPSVISARQIK
jgi:hypothetical protein